MNIYIRNEQPEDYRVSEEVTREAFWNRFVPGCNEHFLLHTMRGHPDYIKELAFVAQVDGQLVGNIVYTKSHIIRLDGSKTNTVTFGPVSVLPRLKNQGIGEALIRHSLSEAKKLGHPAVLIMGDPRYYHKFGFRCAEAFDITTSDNKFAVALMALALIPNALFGGGAFFDSQVFQIGEEGFEQFDQTFPSKIKETTESQRAFQIISSLLYNRN